MSQQSLLAAIKKCLDSGEYSDLTIKCGSDVHKVHKMIVCTQSDFFAGSIRFPGEESEESKVHLPNDEPAIVKLIVKYFYTGDYTCDPVPASCEKPSHNEEHELYTYDFPHSCMNWRRGQGCPPLCPHHKCSYGDDGCNFRCSGFICSFCEDGDYHPVGSPHGLFQSRAKDLLVHAKMYEIADKYNIAGLKELSKEKFRNGCEKYWDADAFPVAVKYTFSTDREEDEGMREIVIATLAKHTKLIKKSDFQVLMEEFGSLSFGVLLWKGSELGWF